MREQSSYFRYLLPKSVAHSLCFAVFLCFTTLQAGGDEPASLRAIDEFLAPVKPKVTLSFNSGLEEDRTKHLVFRDKTRTEVAFGQVLKSVQGVSGKGVAFGGKNSAIYIRSRLRDTRVVAFWAKPASLAPTFSLLSFHGSDGGEGIGVASYEEKIATFSWSTDKKWNGFEFEHHLVARKWNHVAFVFDWESSSFGYFLNGRFQVAHRLEPPPTNLDASLAISNSYMDQAFDGDIDEVIVSEAIPEQLAKPLRAAVDVPPKAGVSGDPKTPSPDIAKSAPPDPMAVEAVLKELRELFEADLARAKSFADKADIASRAIRLGSETKNETEKYGLYRFALQVACECDFGISKKALVALNRDFEVDLASEQSAMVGKLLSSGAVVPDDVISEATEDAIADDQFELATQIIAASKEAKRKVKDAASIRKLTETQSKVDKEKAAFDKLKPLLAATGETFADPDVNSVIGRSYVFERENWKKGLVYLFRCSDEKLGRLATMDLLATSDSNKAEVADAYWALAAETKNIEQSNILRRRAAFWYRQIVTTAKGLDRVRFEKRIGEAGGAR